MLELVYKVTERAGVTLFEPRPFWQLNNYARSGSAADPSKVPPGAEIVHGVYATRGSFIPFYFAPRHCPRFSIDPRAEENALPVLQSWFGPFPRQSSRLIVFLDADRDALTRAAFSVYAFDVRCFRMLPTREYFADAAVTPIREERHTNALTAYQCFDRDRKRWLGHSLRRRPRRPPSPPRRRPSRRRHPFLRREDGRLPSLAFGVRTQS
jgi:hypothetical protein